MPLVFVNYRNEDGHYGAALIDEALSDRFGSHRVFRDSKSIGPSQDFDTEILTALRESRVLLVVIGPHWLTVTNAAGQRKLDDPEDWVRREIEYALETGMLIVPVLLHGASPLTEAQVPADIAGLVTKQALRVNHRNLHADLHQLSTALIDLVPELAAAPSPAPTRVDARLDQPWTGGAEITVDGHCYLIHDGGQQQTAADNSWIWRQAEATELEPSTRPVLLRGVHVARRTDAARERRQALLTEADLLTELSGRPGLPRLLTTLRTGADVTLVQPRPKAKSLRDTFGPADWPLDAFRAGDFLRHIRGGGAVLGELHRRGRAHRTLDPDVLLVDRGRLALRDLGLAALAPIRDEGPATYRAPEQQRHRDDLDQPRVDVYQLAAITYHVLTAHPPGPVASPPVGATNPRLPRGLDDLLAAALAADPARRPADAAAFATALGPVLAELREGDR